MTSAMIRLFIAIELPDDVQRALGRVQHELQRQLPDRLVRWTRPAGIHLTLKFLGDTPAAQVPAIAQGIATAAAAFAPCPLTVAGLGCFPHAHQPRVLWVGLSELPRSLLGLQRAVDLQMSRLNFAREERAFAPHLTLGRVQERATAAERATLTAVLARTQVGVLGTMTVNAVTLFQSQLQAGGAIYTALAHSSLSAAAAKE